MSASYLPQRVNSVSLGNVIFNISAPAGTNALDLTNLAGFQGMMFISSNCHIGSDKAVGHNTNTLATREKAIQLRR